MGEFDRTMKSLVDNDPEALVRFILHEWQRQQETVLPEEFLALQEPTLWPLAMLTDESVDRIIIQKMVAELLEEKRYNTLALGYTVASWRLHDKDLDWFTKESEKMYEFVRESPILKWAEEDATERTARKYEQQLLEERKQAEAKLSAERKQAEAKLSAERKEMLATFQQTVVELVARHFPTLQRFAKTQVRSVKEPGLLHQTMLDLAQACDADEAENLLFALTEKEEDADD